MRPSRHHVPDQNTVPSKTRMGWYWSNSAPMMVDLYETSVYNVISVIRRFAGTHSGPCIGASPNPGSPEACDGWLCLQPNDVCPHVAATLEL